MIRKLVLLPGMDGTGNLFEDFVKALPATFEAITARYPVDVSLPYSDLADIVRSLAPQSEPFVLVAESFSTPLAIQYAKANPPNLKGLVLCAGFVTSPVRGWLHLVCTLFLPVMFRMGLPDSVSRLFLVGSTGTPTLLAEVRAAITSVTPSVLSSRVQAVLACDARSELSQISVPILYIQATQDRLVPASCLEETRRIKPGVAVAVLDGPHLLFQSKPQEAEGIVASFVEGLV